MISRSLLVGMIAAVLLNSSAVWAEGDFYVIGTGKVGTKITSVPIEITKSGFYFFTGDLIYQSTSGNAITVKVDNVTIDLMGFSLTTASGAWADQNGIVMSGRANVEVRNGTIWGFDHAVYEDSANGRQHRVINVRIAKGGATTANFEGVWLRGQNHLIKNCTAMDCWHGLGLESGLITDCLAANCDFGIWNDGPGSVLRSVACNNGFANFSFGDGVHPTRILVDRNSAFGGGINYRINTLDPNNVVITANNAGTP